MRGQRRAGARPQLHEPSIIPKFAAIGVHTVADALRLKNADVQEIRLPRMEHSALLDALKSEHATILHAAKVAAEAQAAAARIAAEATKLEEQRLKKEAAELARQAAVANKDAKAAALLAAQNSKRLHEVAAAAAVEAQREAQTKQAAAEAQRAAAQSAASAANAEREAAEAKRRAAAPTMQAPVQQPPPQKSSTDDCCCSGDCCCTAMIWASSPIWAPGMLLLSVTCDKLKYGYTPFGISCDLEVPCRVVRALTCGLPLMTLFLVYMAPVNFLCGDKLGIDCCNFNRSGGYLACACCEHWINWSSGERCCCNSSNFLM